jgi:hypothetical protein
LYPDPGYGEVTPLATVQAEDGTEAGAILYRQAWQDGPGETVVASMDPVFHHGSNFMPSATRLLHGVLRWIVTAR